MITYRAPLKDLFAYFISVPGGHLGPYSFGADHEFDFIETRAPDDSIDESPAVYGENNVSHSQLHAKLEWSPLLALQKSNNLTYWPCYRKTAGGNYTGSSVRVSKTSILKVGDRSSPVDSNFSIVTGARSVDTYRLYSRFSNVSSITTVTGFVVTNTTYSMGSDGQLTTTSRVKTYSCPDVKFHRTSAYDSHPYENEDGESFHMDLYNGKYPHVILSDVTTTTVSSALWYKTAVGPSIEPHAVLKGITVLPTYKWTEKPDVKSSADLLPDVMEQLDDNNVNMIAFIKDIRKPWELIPKLKELSKLKTHASNYLGYQYGILPTIGDLKLIHEAFTKHQPDYVDRNGFKVLSAGSSGSVSSLWGTRTTTNRMKLVISSQTSGMVSLSEGLHNIGLFPNLVDLYDLIPYSFVVDWFVNIGDQLEKIDARGRAATLDVKYSTSSTKTVTDFKMPEHLHERGITGDIQHVSYLRTSEASSPSPPLNFEGQFELPNHWLEAGALIITRSK